MNESLIAPTPTRRYRFIPSTDFIPVPSYSIYNDIDYPELDEYASDWVVNKEYGYDLLVPITPGTAVLPADEGRPIITRAQVDAMWTNVGTNLFDLGNYNKIQIYTSSCYVGTEWSHYCYCFGLKPERNQYYAWHSNNEGNVYSEIRLVDNEFCPKMFGIQNFSAFNRSIYDWNFDVYENNEWVNISHNQDSAPVANEVSRYILNNDNYYNRMRIRVSSSGNANYTNIGRLRVWGYYKKKINWFMLRTDLDGYLIKG